MKENGGGGKTRKSKGGRDSYSRSKGKGKKFSLIKHLQGLDTIRGVLQVLFISISIVIRQKKEKRGQRGRKTSRTGLWEGKEASGKRRGKGSSLWAPNCQNVLL